jgi:hypothetical protein
MIDLRCPRCGTIHHAGEEHIGYSLRCSSCGDTIPIVRQDGRNKPSSSSIGKTDYGTHRVQPMVAKGRHGNHKNNSWILSRRAWPYQLLGAAMVLGGLLYLNRSQLPEKTPTEQPRSGDGRSQANPQQSTDSNGPIASTEAQPRSAHENRPLPDSTSEQNNSDNAATPDSAVSFDPSTVKPPPVRKTGHRDLGVDVAIPNFPRIPLRSGPNEDATQIRTVSDRDILVVIDRKPQSGWYDVIDVRSGKEGWVRADSVEVNLTKHPAPASKFSEQYVGSDAAPKVTVINQTLRNLSLNIGVDYFTVPPNSQLPVSLTEGTFRYYGAEPDVVPAMGTQEFKRGYEYTWKFWIDTTVVRLP